MQGGACMKRFVTYIYAYENNSKNQNVGFAKVDIRGDYCQVEIHLKRTGYTNVKCPVYLFVREKETLLGVNIGEIILVNGSGDFVRQLTCDQVGETSYCMNDMKGILIFLNDTVMFASQWDEKAIYRENFKRYEEAESVPEVQTVPRQEEPQQTESERIPEAEHYEAPGESAQPESVQTESVKSDVEMETEAVKEMQGAENLWQVLWEKLMGMYGVETMFENIPQMSGIRMELKDIKELPKKYWYLGSNSFLLHGFFNYRHLLLGRMDDGQKEKWFVGVPGVYQNQEKVLAAIFGFPEFRQEKDTEIKTGQFGYWYRFMDE